MGSDYKGRMTGPCHALAVWGRFKSAGDLRRRNPAGSNDAKADFMGSKPLKSLETFNYPTLTAAKLYPIVIL